MKLPFSKLIFFRTATILITMMGIALMSCGKSEDTESIELINEPATQDSLFNKLVALTKNSISDSDRLDSLAFLILPIQASCPSCRKKVIDSIIYHKKRLPESHYIIISANSGRKVMGSFFKDQDYELPDFPGRIFLDSADLAGEYELYKEKPTIYYTLNQKAYKKVAAIPSTVKEDLREFFSGYRTK